MLYLSAMKSIVFVIMLTVAAFAFRVPSPVDDDVNHAAILRQLNSETLEKGKRIYNSSCIACHGADGTAALPQARSFNKDVMRFGTRPYDMWQTITKGAGTMPAQSWLTPEERYYVIQYIRESFIKKANPGQYFAITPSYLESLPRSKNAIAQQRQIARSEALKGNIRYGQDWFSANAGNYGAAIYSQLKDQGTSMLTVQLGNNAYISYNLLRMGSTALWKGTMDLSETKYRKYRGEGQPAIKGTVWEGVNLWQWAYGGKSDSLHNATGVRTSLPEEYMQYHGHYTSQRRTILSYAIEGRNILEMPEVLNNNKVIAHTLHLEPGGAQSVYIGQLPGGNLVLDSVFATLTAAGGKSFVAAAVSIHDPSVSYSADDSGRMILHIPASDRPMTIQVLRSAGKTVQELQAFKTYTATRRKNTPPADLTKMVQGGAPRWPQKIRVAGKLNTGRPHFDPLYSKDADKTSPAKAVSLPSDYPYAVDNIPLPFQNPWNAWIRPTSLGFKSNGDLVIATYTGDVWVATGIDASLKNIHWQRIAAGLYEPMGLKVVNDQIFVTCRNGIVLLHDLNGDGETDFYQNFYTDHDVSSFFHAFNFGLETDSQGNFYYAKVGAFTDNKEPGSVVKISPDGRNAEHIGTGFRTNNGITLTPDDRIFVSDNQGNWIPANKINLVRSGGFYGYVPNQYDAGKWSPDGKTFTSEQGVKGTLLPHVVPVPDAYDPPAIWLPQEFDNSPGGGAWSDESWGPLGNRFIHSSFGRGWLYAFYPQEVNGLTQGAMLALPFQFDAGIQRVAVNPADKQLYTTGLTGWDDGVASQYGVLARVRYKGGEGHMITGVSVVKDGIQLNCNFEPAAAAYTDLSKYRVTRYNYKWTSRYGSDHYSVSNPGTKGEDTLQVSRVSPGADGKSLVITIPELGPAETVCFRFEIPAKSGAVVKDAAYLTIHHMPEQ